MNPSCLICDIPASRVCRHPSCAQSPFFCSGTCHKGLKLSQQLHTHDGAMDCISYQQFEKKIEEENQRFEPSLFERQYIQSIKKKVLISKEHLMQQANLLQTKMDRLEQYLHEEGKRVIQHESNELLERISKKGQNIFGATISQLYKKEQNKKQNIQFVFVEQITTKFDKGLSEIQNFYVSNILDVENIIKSQKLVQQAIILEKQKEMTKVLQKYKQARVLNDSNYLIHHHIGRILCHFNQLDTALESCLKVLELQPHSWKTINNIGIIFRKQQNFDEAIKWYTQAISINGQNAALVFNRGSCYLDSNRYTKAINDFQKALKLEPTNQLFQKKMLLAQNKLKTQVD